MRWVRPQSAVADSRIRRIFYCRQKSAEKNPAGEKSAEILRIVIRRFNCGENSVPPQYINVTYAAVPRSRLACFPICVNRLACTNLPLPHPHPFLLSRCFRQQYCRLLADSKRSSLSAETLNKLSFVRDNIRSFTNQSIQVNSGMSQHCRLALLYLCWIIHFTYNVCIAQLCYVLQSQKLNPDISRFFYQPSEILKTFG